MNITIKLSKEEVEEIIRAHVKKSGYVAKKINFVVSSHEEGDQRDSYRVTAFDGVEIDAGGQ